jgi:protein O-GlcNAc transferase
VQRNAERLKEAVEWHRQGHLARAEMAYREVLRDEPRQPDALHLLGVALTQAGRPAEGAEHMRESLAVRPDQPMLHANLGNALAALGQHEQALGEYQRTLAALPTYAPALNGRGNVLSKLARWEEAVSSYRAAIECMPTLIEAHTNHGLALVQLGRSTEALESFDRALALAPTHATALQGCGTVRLALGDSEGARQAFEKLIAANPRHAAALTGRGQILLESARYAEALAAFDSALEVERDRPATLFLRGRTLMQLARPREAAECFHRVSDLDAGYEYAAGARLWAELHACAWGSHAELLPQIEAAVLRGEPAAFPFVFFSVCDSPEAQLHCARQFAARYRPEVHPLWSGERYGHERIRLAYVSEDFRSHPTAYLMMGLWEAHDRRRFDTIAVSLRPREHSPVGHRIEAAFEQFIDASALADAEISRRMRDLEVDIAVDLMGYTGGSLRSILTRRPAPLQVNYLGYPGTLGSADADYLIADEFVILPLQQSCFTEQIVYLPATYQPNDRQRAVAEHRPSRAEVGLPRDAFVFCSFNNSYKLNPRIYDVWCRLLRGVPGSVLWLIPGAADSIENLRAESAARGVDPGRLILAPNVPNPDHIARIGLADLCLDTAPVNGATTTSDALWAGVPVVTCAGRSFVSRMAGSLLTGIGLPELITSTIGEYEALALALATDSQRLTALRAKLAECKTDSALFDTNRACRNLEAAFSEMWRRHERGEPPQGFAVR